MAGSSPRGRGTEPVPRLLQTPRRFIPAWAGNRIAPELRRLREPVHPRVGGEQEMAEAIIDGACGSSPRGRGTVIAENRFQAHDRFIPAWAGNRQGRGAACCPSPVHPRVGGEQVSSSATPSSDDGSSPRGRGTDSVTAAQARMSRFIPAWAGNSHRDGSGIRPMPVHPRVGGEQENCSIFIARKFGSSPRGRGTDFLQPALK